MEFESGTRSKGSERGFTLALRQGQIARGQEQRGEMEMSGVEVLVWSQSWLEAWPMAKKMAMGKLGAFGQPQGALWIRDRANAWLYAEWTEAKARWETETEAEMAEKAAELNAAGEELASTMWRDIAEGKKVWLETLAKVNAEAKAETEAEKLAGVWVWALQRKIQKERVPSYMPSGLADSSTIRDILSSLDLNLYGVANDLWHRSLETRDEDSCVIYFISLHPSPAFHLS